MTENSGWASLWARRIIGAVFLTDYAPPDVRKAAIKLIPADSAEAKGLLGRWRHAANLTHPNLLQIFDMGRGELDGAPVLYVVMEYAEENLSSVIAPNRQLAAEEARDILGPVVDALGFVHGKDSFIAASSPRISWRIMIN